MKIRIFSAMLCLLLVFSLLGLCAFAEEKQYVADFAGILTETEEQALAERFSETSDGCSFDFVILTVKDLGSMDLLDYADSFHRNGPYRRDAAILAVDMEDREWCVATYGKGNSYINEATTYSYLEDCFLSELSEGAYKEAFEGYLAGAETLVIRGQQGKAYTAPVPWGKNALIAIVIGLIAALIVVLSLRSQLKSVAFKSNAAGYVKQGSFRLTKERDLFLFRTHTRVYSPRQKSSGGSSGGGSRGGGRGRF
jgi:uncharacterized protein